MHKALQLVYGEGDISITLPSSAVPIVLCHRISHGGLSYDIYGTVGSACGLKAPFPCGNRRNVRLVCGRVSHGAFQLVQLSDKLDIFGREMTE